MKRSFLKKSLSFLLTVLMLAGCCYSLSYAAFADGDTLTNLYDPGKAANGFYKKNNSTGKADFVEYAGHFTSDYIAVTAGDVITFGPAKTNQDFHMMGYDNDKKIVENQIPLNSSTKLTTVCTLNSYNGIPYAIYSYTVPAGVTQVQVTNYKDVNTIFTVTKNQPFDAEGFETYWTSNTTRSETFKKFASIIPEQTAPGTVPSGEGSVLAGKSALFVGDSITYGAFDGATYKSWAGRIGQKHAMNYINAGVSGASISTTRDRNPSQGRIITQLSAHAGKSFDYVIMHGGVNDAWDEVAVGTVTDSYDVSKLNPATYIGGLEQTFAKAKELFPTATYGFILNFALPKCHYGAISDMSAYMSEAKKACEKWGVDYLDLYFDENFCYKVLKVDTLTYFGDTYYCHPNAAGHDLIAPRVEAWMKTLVPKSQTLVNAYNNATATAGHYHPQTNAHGSSNYYSNVFNVKAGNTITFGPTKGAGQDFHVIAYDASGKIIDTDFNNSSVLTVADDSFRNGLKIFSYTAPANATSVRLTVHKDLRAVFTATVNQPFDAFAFWNYWNSDTTRASVFHKTKRDDSRLDGYSGKPFAPDYTSTLRGRSVLFLGDSIVSSERDTSLFYRGWADRIGMINGMDYVNAGKSGTSFSTQKSDRIIKYLTDRTESSFDYIITNGGVNDAWVSAPVGTLSTGFALSDFNKSTFAGALEEFFFTARQKYPNATIGYIMTFSMPSANYGKVSNMEAYYAVAKQICEKWNVPYLDLYHNTELCNNQLKTATTTYLADYVHPDGAGVDLVYPLIEAWMKTLPYNGPVEPEKPEIDTDSVLYEKSVLFMGDDVVYGRGDLSTNRSFAGRISVKNGMKMTNVATMGATLCQAAADKLVWRQAFSHFGESFDYIIISAGMNDIQNGAPLGKISDISPEQAKINAFDVSTYAGALEHLFFRITTNFKNTEYGFILPYATPKASGALADMSEYVTIAKAICEKWGISYLDLYNDEEFCYQTLKVHTDEFLTDHLYPTTEGYDLLATEIEAWMKTLGAPIEPPADDVPDANEPDEVPVEEEETTAASEETTAETEAPADEGCASAIAPMAAALATATAAAATVTLKKKKED